MEAIFILGWFIVLPIVAGILASNKKRNVAGWVVSTFIFGIFALVILIVLPENIA
jgi:hypothetical protein